MVEYVCIYRQNLALNNLQRLICHKTQTTKPNLATFELQFCFSSISCLTKYKQHSLSYYIAGWRIEACIPFPWVLVLYEMQKASFRIWIQVIKSISYDDNHYTLSATLLNINNELAWKHTFLFLKNKTSLFLICLFPWNLIQTKRNIKLYLDGIAIISCVDKFCSFENIWL